MGALLHLRAAAKKPAVSSASAVDSPELGQVVRHIRRLSESPSNLGAALSKGVQSIQNGVVLISQDPPQISSGLSVMGISLLDALDYLLTDEGKGNWTDYDNFVKAWNQTFNNIDATFANVTNNFNMFSVTGKTSYLIKALHTVLDEGGIVAYASAPNQVGQEISKYLSSLKETVSSLGEALNGFEKGEIAGGIEDLYFGIRRASEPWVPSDLQNDLTYNAIMGATDDVMGSLSRHVLDYRKRLLEKSVCWKQNLRRDRARPTVCPAKGYKYDGESHCWPTSTDCWKPHPNCVSQWTQDGRTYANCTILAPKPWYKTDNLPWCSHYIDYNFWNHMAWDNCIQVPCDEGMSPITTTLEEGMFGKKPQGTVPAQCGDPSYPEKIDDWCFADCPTGYVSDGSKCWSECRAMFPADDNGLMCGRNPVALQMATQEMAAAVARTALTTAMSISAMLCSGCNVNGNAIGATVNAFVDVGKPFARPLCTQDLILR